MGKTKKNQGESTSRAVYATPADFKQIFAEDVSSLYLLSLLLTGSPDNAEECFVEGIGESTKENYVFKEWARSWARRAIVQSAIRVMARMDESWTTSGSAELLRGMDRIPAVLHAEVRAILKLAPLERFVFVLSVLERYSDNDCSILLRCARRDVPLVRTRAMQQLGIFLSSKYPMDSTSDTSTVHESLSTLATPLIAQYFAAPVLAGSVSP